MQVCEQCGQVKCDKCHLPILPQKSFLSRNKLALGCLSLLLIFVGLPVLFFTLFLFAIGSQVNKQDANANIVAGQGSDKIALINITGEIVDNDSSGGLGINNQVYSEQRFRKVLRDIENDSQVKALLIKVNSPGGSAAASEQIYRDILNYKSKTHNKVVFYYSDMAASGGYYLSVAGDEIIASPQAITGSIGVIIEYLNFGDLAQKYGVQEIVYKSGPHKDIVSEFRNPTDEEKQIMQSLISDAYDNFVAVVSQGRHLPESDVLKLADGRVYSARQAKQLKLIDDTGSFDDAIDKAKNLAGLSQASVVEYGQQTFLASFLGSVSQKINLSFLPQGVLPKSQTPKLMYLYTP